jgi:Uma2 family endonuclease
MSSEKVKTTVKTPARIYSWPGSRDKTEKYYDWHPTKEDLMGESVPQSKLIDYLQGVLTWLYRQKACFIVANLNIYQDAANPMEYPLAPDLAFFRDMQPSAAELASVRSWKVYEPNRPIPTVVFEISSKDTWEDDLAKKPTAYGRMGVREYFAYDPSHPPYWRVSRKWPGIRLLGWRYNSAGEIEEIKPNDKGWLYSNELQHWLGSDGRWLRLYDANLRMALTGEEVAVQEREAREAAELLASQERQVKERLQAKLRELGFDPDNL